MKSFKKLMALVIAAVMIVGTIGLNAAFAAPGDLTPDSSVSITGLDVGDEVNLYKILQWTDGTGWTLAPGFTTLDNENINKLIANEKGVELSKADLDQITTFIKNAGPAIAPSTSTVTADPWTQNVDPGLYIALVKPAEAGVVYNPIVVGADFTSDNGTNEIDASTAVMGSSSVAKKKKVTVEKTEPKITNDIGDTYHFTIETTIPAYSDAFVNTSFVITDEVSQYLAIQGSTVVIKDGAGTTIDASEYTLSVPDARHMVITFDDDYIKDLPTAQEIVVTYDAKLTITAAEAALLSNAVVMDNKVTIDFPNNPNDDDDRTVLKDGTIERTFTIDGTLLGHSGWRTSEVVKVGKDENGNPIESMVSFSSGESHAALDGAEFGLYTNYDSAEAKSNTLAVYGTDGSITTHGLYHNEVFTTGKVTSKDGGLLYIPGLDAGTYYLRELSAPKGYIADQDVHTIKIEVTKWKDVDVTEYYTISGNPKTVTWSEIPVSGSTPYTYTVRDIEEYKVTVDGQETDYQMDLKGPYTSKSTVLKSSDAEIANTKGVELPSTGGMGTKIFYIVGTILVLGAGIILISRRRMGVN